MDTVLPQKFPFILDRNLAKANWTENRVCISCDTVVLDLNIIILDALQKFSNKSKRRKRFKALTLIKISASHNNIFS